jgi:hypothetical protein
MWSDILGLPKALQDGVELLSSFSPIIHIAPIFGAGPTIDEI